MPYAAANAGPNTRKLHSTHPILTGYWRAHSFMTCCLQIFPSSQKALCWTKSFPPRRTTNPLGNLVYINGRNGMVSRPCHPKTSLTSHNSFGNNTLRRLRVTSPNRPSPPSNACSMAPSSIVKTNKLRHSEITVHASTIKQLKLPSQTFSSLNLSIKTLPQLSTHSSRSWPNNMASPTLGPPAPKPNNWWRNNSRTLCPSHLVNKTPIFEHQKKWHCSPTLGFWIRANSKPHQLGTSCTISACTFTTPGASILVLMPWISDGVTAQATLLHYVLLRSLVAFSLNNVLTGHKPKKQVSFLWQSCRFHEPSSAIHYAIELSQSLA